MYREVHLVYGLQLRALPGGSLQAEEGSEGGEAALFVVVHLPTEELQGAEQGGGLTALGTPEWWKNGLKRKIFGWRR